MWDELAHLSECQMPPLPKNMPNSQCFCESQVRFGCEYVLHNVKQTVFQTWSGEFGGGTPDTLRRLTISELFSW